MNLFPRLLFDDKGQKNRNLIFMQLKISNCSIISFIRFLTLTMCVTGMGSEPMPLKRLEPRSKFWALRQIKPYKKFLLYYISLAPSADDRPPRRRRNACVIHNTIQHVPAYNRPLRELKWYIAKRYGKQKKKRPQIICGHKS